MKSNKIKTYKEIKEITDEYNSKRWLWVLTNGCFDIIHLGHIRYLKKAKREGMKLIVALNSDKSVRALKGSGRPIISQKDRAEILAALDCVGYVFIFNDVTFDKVLKRLKPPRYAKGGDYTIDTIVQSERKIIEGYGGKILLIPSEKNISTTKIIQEVNRCSRK